MKEKLERLEKAKDAVHWLLENPDGLVDMHGIAYWAGEVERLWLEIRTLVGQLGNLSAVVLDGKF